MLENVSPYERTDQRDLVTPTLPPGLPAGYRSVHGNHRHSFFRGCDTPGIEHSATFELHWPLLIALQGLNRHVYTKTSVPASPSACGGPHFVFKNSGRSTPGHGPWIERLEKKICLEGHGFIPYRGRKWGFCSLSCSGGMQAYVNLGQIERTAPPYSGGMQSRSRTQGLISNTGEPSRASIPVTVTVVPSSPTTFPIDRAMGFGRAGERIQKTGFG